jgi:hypothetical protein
VLVKWKHYPVDEATWENEAKLKVNFSYFCEKGQ